MEINELKNGVLAGAAKKIHSKASKQTNGAQETDKKSVPERSANHRMIPGEAR